MLYWPNGIAPPDADKYLALLVRDVAWRQGQIMMFGKRIDEPRLTAWYGDPGATYRYSGKQNQPLPWINPLVAIRDQLLETLNSKWAHVFDHIQLNSVLCNYYRNGQDSMGWHADDEAELGLNPLIVSVNFGETRRFLYRRSQDKKDLHELALGHGTVLVMGGDMQNAWQHSVPKEKNKLNARINLTYRWIKPK